jgi:hypothetical protein
MIICQKIRKYLILLRIIFMRIHYSVSISILFVIFIINQSFAATTSDNIINSHNNDSNIKSTFKIESFSKEAELLKIEAKLGNTEAQYYLGVMYMDGIVVPQDNEEALIWYRMAALQGEPSAQLKLGLIYSKGQGVPKNLIEAYAWWTVAIANGIEVADSTMNSARRKLMPTQIERLRLLPKNIV